MIIVAIFNIIVVFFAYLARYKNCDFSLKVSFFLIFLFLALRYDYGNDYSSYLEKFLDLNSKDSIDYFDESWRVEPGWLFLCRLFKPLGFFTMVAFLAAFNCFVYYRFIKKYVSPVYYWFAVFLYVFDPGFMLTDSSAMRQSLAICLFLIAIDYLNNKDTLRYFLCIGLASLFHNSALVLLPLYFLGIFDWKINKITAISLYATYLILFLYGASFMPVLNDFISIYFSRYEIYEGSTEVGTGLGLILNSVLFGFVLYYEPFQNKQMSFLFKIVILSYLIIPLSLGLPMLTRVGMYFQPAIIIVFPVIISSIKNSILKIAVLGIMVVLALYTFYGFFNSEIFGKAFSTYKTILSAPEFY